MRTGELACPQKSDTKLQELPRLPKPRITGSVAGTIRQTRSPKTAPQPDDPDPGLSHTGECLWRADTLHAPTPAETGCGVGAETENSALLTPQLKPGTKLLRQFQGEMHEVLVADEGFEYRGKRYESLSEIARQITGTRWSGPLFFGLKQGQKARSAQ